MESGVSIYYSQNGERIFQLIRRIGRGLRNYAEEILFVLNALPAKGELIRCVRVNDNK